MGWAFGSYSSAWQGPFRVALLMDVTDRASSEGARTVGQVLRLGSNFVEVPPMEPEDLLRLLNRDRPRWAATLPEKKHSPIRTALHVDRANCASRGGRGTGTGDRDAESGRGDRRIA